MNKPNFEFKKITGDKYAFVMKSEDILRTEEVSKQYAKDHYKELQRQKQEALNNLAQVHKKLERTKVEKNAELEHFIELANSAAKYAEHMKAEQDHSSVLEMLEKINESMAQIEKVIPEVKRMAK